MAQDGPTSDGLSDGLGDGPSDGLGGGATDRLWRRLFAEALGDSLDLYTELFEQSPAPMIVEDWSTARGLVMDLSRRVGAENVESHLLEHPDEAETIWMSIGTIAVNPAMLAINRISSPDSYDDYIDEWEPTITPALAHVLGNLAQGEYRSDWPEMEVDALDRSRIIIKGRVHIPPAYRDTWKVVFSTYEDMTEERRHEADLLHAKETAEQANAAKSDFVASMSHEFRTPLNAILGFAQMLQAETFGSLGDARYREYVDDMIASGEHLLSLVTDILDLAKAEARTFDLDETEMDLALCVRQALIFVRDRAARGGLILESSLPPDLPPIRADTRRIHQVLLNLVTNAIRFSDAGSVITVSAERLADGGLALRVTDQGRGMSGADLAVVMEPFVQAGSRPHALTGGWGLGLPIARTIADLHGGRLELESAPGEGTTATLVLPKERILEG